MKVSKAIEIQTDMLKIGTQEATPDVNDALKLGIEALKRYQAFQSYGDTHSGLLLPGETPEDEVEHE